MATDSQTFPEFLRLFADTVHKSTSDLSKVSERDANSHLPDKWSAKQILGHLIDSAANNHQRFVRAQFSSDLTFPGYDQEQWVQAQHYSEASWADLVKLWSLYNLHLVHLLRAIPNETLVRERQSHNLDQIAWKTVDKNQPVTLEYFVRDYFGHLQHHVRQIFQAVKTASRSNYSDAN